MRDFMIANPRCMFILEPGSGKTLATLDALFYLNPNHHVLVIAPKHIAKLTWQDEIDNWGYPFRTVSLLLPPQKREIIYDNIHSASPAIHFINRELVAELPKKFIGTSWPFKTIIIDESQSFKNYKAKRFEALKPVLPFVERIIELTGTANPNGLEDLWSQTFILDQGARLGKNITAFRNTFFIPGRCINGYPYEWMPRPGAKEAIYDRIKDIVVSMEGIPHGFTIQTHTVSLNSDERKIYNTLKKERILTIEDTDVDGQNAAVLAGKLTQLASGTLYKPSDDVKTSSKRGFWEFHNHGINVCRGIIDASDSPVMIAYGFKVDRDRLLNAFQGKAVCFDGKPETMAAWNNGQIPILLIHPASAGHGLNFQHGGHTLIWYSPPWNLEHWIQTNRRLARQGQKNPVTIHVIMTENTIHGKIIYCLNKKDLNVRELAQAVKLELKQTA